MTNDLSSTATVPVTTLPESVRIPLHSLQADLGYLIGRVIADGSCGPMIVKSMKDRLDQIEACFNADAPSAKHPTERVALIEAEAKRRCIEDAEISLDYLACQDRKFRHDDRRPWWQAKFVSRIESEIERLEQAGFVVMPSAATSAEPVAIPEGFQLVPIRPTQWMMDAGLYQSSADTQWEDVYSMWVDMLRVAETEGMEAEPATGLPATPPSSGNADAVREAFNALSMWCTSARFKIRGRGGFDDQTEREIGIGLVEAEIDRRAAALSSAPVAGEWQDMETARLDGKPFLARYQWLGEHRFMVIRRSLEGPWWIRDGSSQTVGGERDAIQFTDWQALPAGPISRNDRGGSGS